MNPSDILKSVCHYYGVSKKDIFTDLKSHDIADLVQRDRSTVSTTIKAVNTRCLYYPEVRQEVINVENLFE